MEIVMKVNIGPYKNYIGPYQIAEKIFFWIDRQGIWADDDPRYERWDHRACDKLGDWLDKSWVAKFCEWVDSKNQRKIKIRIDKHDTWSMDHTLALIVHPMLVQLRDTNHGYFFPDVEDVPHIGRGDETDFGHSDTKAKERYDWVMDELVWTFGALIDEDEDLQFYDKETHVWDIEGRKAYDDRISNGLRLFGRYYRALWD
jgi:hypothetical protein